MFLISSSLGKALSSSMADASCAAFVTLWEGVADGVPVIEVPVEVPVEVPGGVPVEVPVEVPVCCWLLFA